MKTYFCNSGLIFIFVQQKGASISAKRKIVRLKKHFFCPHVVWPASSCRPETDLKAWKRDADIASFFSILLPLSYRIRLSNRYINQGVACSALKRKREPRLSVWLFESAGLKWVTNRFLPMWRESYISEWFRSGVQMENSCCRWIVILTIWQSGTATSVYGIGRVGKADAALLRIGNR